jgi:kinetochore protein NDC80
MIGRQSLAGHPPPMLVKDPRPIREKAWQTQSIRSLISFLVQLGYNQSPLSLKSLQAPSSKDFQFIFRFLVGHLDPHFEFKRKIEEDVHYILKSLR